MRDLVIHPSPATHRHQWGAFLGVEALFVALTVGCVAMLIETRSWVAVPALIIVGALAVWYPLATLPRLRRASPNPGGLPVLVANQYGIGDGFALVPWPQVASVGISQSVGGSHSPEGQLVREVTNKVAMLDGHCHITITCHGGPDLGRSVPGLRTVSAGQLRLELTDQIPPSQYRGTADAVASFVQAMGVPLSR